MSLTAISAEDSVEELEVTGFGTLQRRATKWRLLRERLSPCEMSERYRYIGSGAAPGKYSVRNHPFQREMLDVAVDSGIKEITYLMPSQVAKTVCIESLLFYYTVEQPSEVMMTFAGQKALEKFLPRLRREIKATKRWKLDLTGHANDINNKGATFRGSQVHFGLATSSQDLRQIPARVIINDEIDLFPEDVNGEGSPFDLLKARTRTYEGRSRTINASTPTTSDGPIWAKYQESDQRIWCVRCLSCGEAFPEEFLHLRWEPRPNSKTHQQWAHGVLRGEVAVWYECPHCAYKHTRPEEKKKLNTGGFWKITQPEVKGHAGFRATSLASPNTQWAQLAADFLNARHVQIRGDDRKRKYFANHEEAKPWDSLRIHLEEKVITDRVNPDYHKGEVPEWCDFVTMGMDVQHDRVYWVARGWRKADQRCHVVGWGMVMGSIDDPEFRKGALRDVVMQPWTWTGRRKHVAIACRVCIDSGEGLVTEDVYAFCNLFPGLRVLPIKGASQAIGGGHIWSHRDKAEGNHRGRLHTLDVHRLMDFRSKLFTMRDPGSDSAVSFPAEVLHDPDFQRQMASKQRDRKGKWDLRPGYAQDHYGDADNYCVGAALIAGLVTPAKSHRPKPGVRVVRRATTDRFGRSI